jgi:hypothetical protein
LESDWAGDEIFVRLYQGKGADWWIINDPKWADYMMSPAQPDQEFDVFRQVEVKGALHKIATKILDSGVPDNHVTVVKEQFNAGLANGQRRTGYNFLNRTNKDVGDFQIAGGAVKVTGSSSRDVCQEVNFQVGYRWNDRMDPNFDYLTDRLYWAALKGLRPILRTADPTPYNIHIEWSQESTYRITDKKDLSTGWPFLPKGSPPR